MNWSINWVFSNILNKWFSKNRNEKKWILSLSPSIGGILISKNQLKPITHSTILHTNASNAYESVGIVLNCCACERIDRHDEIPNLHFVASADATCAAYICAFSHTIICCLGGSVRIKLNNRSTFESIQAAFSCGFDLILFEFQISAQRFADNIFGWRKKPLGERK